MHFLPVLRRGNEVDLSELWRGAGAAAQAASGSGIGVQPMIYSAIGGKPMPH